MKIAHRTKRQLFPDTIAKLEEKAKSERRKAARRKKASTIQSFIDMTCGKYNKAHNRTNKKTGSYCRVGNELQTQKTQ